MNEKLEKNENKKTADVLRAENLVRDYVQYGECGLKEGQKLAFPEFTEAVQKKIIETGKRTKICGDCQWNRICQEQPSRWSK